MGLQGLHHCQMAVCDGRRGHHQGVPEEDVEEGSSGGKKWKRKEEEEIEAEFGLVMEELWGVDN